MENTQESTFTLPNYVIDILQRLEEAGFEGYAVGGCVRDFNIGVTPKDYDVTTNARTEQIQEIFSGYHVIETGIQHGTLTVMSEGMPIEITTYRIDGEYSDGRHPDSVAFTTDIREDLARRDFTINAIAYSPNRGFVDAYGGIEDIRSQLIRCVGSANKRFGEDALRILRALRFSAVLGFDIEPKTAKAIHRQKHLLKGIAKERITVELLKLICGKNAVSILREYSDVLAEVIPPLSSLYGFEQCNPYHCHDLWEHTLQVIENTPSEPELRIAALFHDIGKPECKSVDQNGIAHYYGHPIASERIARDIFKNYLRLPKAVTESVCQLILWHDVEIEPTPKIIKRRLIKYGAEVLKKLLILKRADIKGQAPEFISRLDKLDESERIMEELISKGGCFSISELDIDGRELMNLGIPQGKEIGSTLRMLLDAVNDERVENEKEQLIEFTKKIKGN